MRLRASTAMKLHAAVCAGEALICLRLGAAVFALTSCLRPFTQPARRLRAAITNPTRRRAAGLALLAYELLDAHADTAQLADGLHTTARGRRALTTCALQRKGRETLARTASGELSSFLAAGLGSLDVR